MKVKTNQSKKEFQPIELNITLESLKELRAFVAQLQVNFGDKLNESCYSDGEISEVGHDEYIEPIFDIAYNALRKSLK